MTDEYESRLQAELAKLARAVPTVPEVEPAEASRQTHGRTKVRSALPVGSLIAAGLVVVAIVVIAPRITPVGTATPSASVPTQTPSLPSPSATESARVGGPGSFSTTGSLTHVQMYAEATLLSDGRVLVTGGADTSISSTNIEGWTPCAPEQYDPATGTFRATGSMVTARLSSTATLLPDGRVLVAGGAAERGTPLSSAELYDPKTNTFSISGSMAGARVGHTATRLEDGRVLVAGGRSDSSGTAARASAELYDPTTGGFTSVGTMVTVRERHTATLLADGRVLIAGGVAPGSNVPLTSAELYDPASGTFSATGSMMVASTIALGMSATLLVDGRVLLTGGQHLSPAELYDPKSGTFSNAGPSTNTWPLATATRLPNGLVLIAGGVDEKGTVAAAELFDPSTDSFRSAGSMATSRYGAAAALLPDGRVLILGGTSVIASSGVRLHSAELYDPAGSQQ